MARSNIKRNAAIAAGFFIGLVMIFAGSLYFSASPVICGSCHEIRPMVETWKTSAHANIGCPACHEAVRPWYRFPETLAARATVLQRDMQAHRNGVRVTFPPASRTDTSTIADENCLECHELSRSITLKFGTLIDHTKHAQRNKSCVSCHLWTAHPPADADRPVLLMARCFTCHGRTPGAKAPGTCSTCHPASFSLRPESHRTEWQARHGKVALRDRQQCVMCHETTFCTNCHGVQMPHPKDWVRGVPGHSTVGAARRSVCAKCHTEKPDLCSMCHHKDYQPTGVPWMRQHRIMVAKRGAAFCMDCHDATYCFNCHVGNNALKGPSQ